MISRAKIEYQKTNHQGEHGRWSVFLGWCAKGRERKVVGGSSETKRVGWVSLRI